MLHFFVCTELQVLFGLSGLIIAKLLELSLKFLDEVLLFEQKFVQRSKLCFEGSLIWSSYLSKCLCFERLDFSVFCQQEVLICKDVDFHICYLLSVLSLNLLGDFLSFALKHSHPRLWVYAVHIGWCLYRPHMDHMLCLLDIDYDVLGLRLLAFCFLDLSLVLLQHRHQPFLFVIVLFVDSGDCLLLLCSS